MGMNYYWNPELVQTALGLENVDQDDPKVHIGKMSAAGRYCKKCGITQHGHTIYVHAGPSKDKTEQCLMDIARLDEHECPNCNQPWEQTSSFTFTMMSHLVTIGNFYNIEIATRNQDPLQKPLAIVVDEYGQPYTAVDFLDNILRQCPIQFQSYGRWS